MVTSLADSLASLLYNYQIMKFVGEHGIPAYGIIMYVFNIFAAIYYGYVLGIFPSFSFQYGAGNHEKLKNLY